MVRLSEITERSDQINIPQADSRKMRLSDAMRVSSFEISPEEIIPEDKGIAENLLEGFQKGVASSPQVAGNMIMAYGDYVRTFADKADKQGLIFGIKPLISGKPIGERIFKAGMRISKSNQKFISERFPEQANFTFADKFAQGVGQGGCITSLSHRAWFVSWTTSSCNCFWLSSRN